MSYIIERYNGIPNSIKVLLFVLLIADQYIILKSLAAVCEACLLYGAIVYISCPAVRLDADRDIDLCYFQSAADVMNSVILFIVICKDSFARCDRGSAGVDASFNFTFRRISIRIAQFNSLQAISLWQVGYCNLIVNFVGKCQRSAIILFGIAVYRDGHLFAVKQRKLQCTAFGDLITRPGGFTIVVFSYDCLIQFPSGDRSTGKSKSLTYFQDFFIRIMNVFAIHVLKVNRDNFTLVG